MNGRPTVPQRTRASLQKTERGVEYSRRQGWMDKPQHKGTFQGRGAAMLPKASGRLDETRWESAFVLTRKPLRGRLLAWVELFASFQIHESGKGVGRAKRREYR